MKIFGKISSAILSFLRALLLPPKLKSFQPFSLLFTSFTAVFPLSHIRSAFLTHSSAPTLTPWSSLEAVNAQIAPLELPNPLSPLHLLFLAGVRIAFPLGSVPGPQAPVQDRHPSTRQLLRFRPRFRRRCSHCSLPCFAACWTRAFLSAATCRCPQPHALSKLHSR